MSIQATCKTDMNDKALLVDALKELYGNDAIQLVENGAEVRGYYTAKHPTILINLKGLYGTAGYAVTADGTYELVYDSTDRRKLKNLLPEKKGEMVHHRLAQVYSRLKVVDRVAKQIRGKVVQNQVDEQGRIKLRIRTVSYGSDE